MNRTSAEAVRTHATWPGSMDPGSPASAGVTSESAAKAGTREMSQRFMMQSFCGTGAAEPCGACRLGRRGEYLSSNCLAEMHRQRCPDGGRRAIGIALVAYE